MKTYGKFFVSVCVALFAFACATDPTEDLGAKVGTENQTTLTLSLEGTKTYLGDENNGTYPLYWSVGDKISVNGVESEPLSKEQAGKSAATFIVSGDHTTYNIAYPAAPANQVLFAAEQKHAGNTSFASGVSTLYGVGSKEEGATLHHLTGVLKFGVTGSAILKKAQISTIDRAPIAGAFNIDFATGKVTPSENAVSTIEYSFGEGVQLSTTTPTYLHITVPAGVYDELYVTLYDNEDGVMYATANAGDDKPLEAGVIRTFSNIAYTPTTHLHVVKDVASLKALPSATSDAVVVCDIDLSDENWTPLEGYSHTLNGNGYAIKGLKAPLFGTTTASIKGLHLEGVNITTTNPIAGALACQFQGAKLSNCSASGKITADLTGATTYVAIGGMVGVAGYVAADGTKDDTKKSEMLENLVNNVSVEVDGDISTNESTAVYVGGCVGFTCTSSADNLLNKGAITVKSTFKTGVAANYFAGTLGYLSPGAGAVISNIANTGAVTVGGTYAKKVQVGGCSGHFGFASHDTVLNGVSNSGAVTISENTSVGSEFDVAGIAGVCAIKNTDNATTINTGAIEIKKGSTSGGSLYVGGCCGWTDKVMTHLSNSGTLTISGGTYKDSRIGGVFGLTKTTTNNLSNSGKLVLDGFSAGESFIGGCVGYESTQKTLDGLNNSGAIELKGVNTTAITVVGGCLATFNNEYGGTIQNSTNQGSIYVDNESTFGVQLLIAGCVARLNKANSGNMLNLTNDAPITVEAKSTTTHLYVAGVGSYIEASNGHSGLTNTANGDISVKKTKVGGALEVAGVVAQVQDSTIELLNNGDIKVEGVSVKTNAIIAGVIAHPNNYTRNDHENNGDVSVDVAATGYLCVGGVEGGSGNNVKTRFVNTGDINISSTTTVGSYMRVGGLTGYLTGTTQLASNDKGGCYNTGNVTFSGTAGNGDDGDTFYMGGAVGYITDKTTGLVGSIESSGNVVFNGTHTGTAIAAIGGVFGINLGNISGMTSIVFSGENLECTGTSPDATTYIGGIVAHTVSPVTGAKAFCNISAYSPDYKEYTNVGIVMGTPYNSATKATNCHIGGSYNFKDDQGGIDNEPLDEFNYIDFVYGATNVTPDEAREDRLGWLEENINSTPKDIDGNPIVSE